MGPRLSYGHEHPQALSVGTPSMSLVDAETKHEAHRTFATHTSTLSHQTDDSIHSLQSQALNITSPGRSDPLPNRKDASVNSPAQEANPRHLPQVDSPAQHRLNTTSAYFIHQSQPQPRITNRPHTLARPPQPTNANAATDLLPWCTTHMRLSEEQVIALSDLAGSLKEVMLLTLRAKVDENVRRAVERAVGVHAAEGIIEFWDDEYVLE